MMTYHIAYLAAFAALACAIVFGLPRVGRIRRTVSVIALGLMATVGYLAVIELQGRPRPIAFDMFAAQEREVLAFRFIEGEAIFLWTSGEGEPMSWRLPWNAEQARKLYSLTEEAKERGGNVMLRPGEDIDSPQMFYRSEIEPLPPKRAD